MSFIKMLKSNESVTIKDVACDKEIIQKTIVEKEESPTEILRGAGFKIKLVTPTSFGTQIDFAKQYDDEDITKVLSGFNIKIKNKSVFIIQ